MRSRIRSVLQVTLRADINTNVTCVLKDLPIHFHTHIISSMAGHCWKAQESDFEESSVIPQSFKLKQGRKKKKKKSTKCWFQNWWEYNTSTICCDATKKASHNLPQEHSVAWYSLNLPEVFQAWQSLRQGMDTPFPKVIF